MSATRDGGGIIWESCAATNHKRVVNWADSTRLILEYARLAQLFDGRADVGP
jgi:hypothetical protein